MSELATPSGWSRVRATLRSPRRAAVAALALAFFGFWVGYGITVFAVLPAEGIPGDLVSVPELVGRDAEEVQRMLQDRRLGYMEAESLHHPTAPAGRVIAQDPLARQLMSRGGTVEVTVSRGPEQRPVPDVVGLQEAQAIVVLEQAGFRPQTRSVDAEVDVGQIVGTRPEPGDELQIPADVTLLVSAGPRIVVVPDLVTRSLTESRATLERLGLRLGRVVHDSTGEAAPGTVLAQNPLPGTSVGRGGEVSVSVAAPEPQPEPEPASNEGESEEGAR